MNTVRRHSEILACICMLIFIVSGNLTTILDIAHTISHIPDHLNKSYFQHSLSDHDSDHEHFTLQNLYNGWDQDEGPHPVIKIDVSEQKPILGHTLAVMAELCEYVEKNNHQTSFYYDFRIDVDDPPPQYS